MKQGRTVGTYFAFLVKEGLFRLRKELFSWRGLLVALFIGYMILDTVTVEEKGYLVSLGVAAVWLMLLFPPRIGKLLYLLPFSRSERKRYIGAYEATYMSFLIAAFLVVGAVATWIAKYSYLTWLMYFVGSAVPFLTLYSLILLFGVVNRKPSSSTFWWFFTTRQTWNEPVDYVGGVKEDCRCVTVTQEKKKWKNMTSAERKNRILGVVLIISMVVTTMQCFGYWLWPVFGGDKMLVFTIGAIAAYVCGGVAVLILVGRIAEELNSTGSTGKEECGCNS